MRTRTLEVGIVLLCGGLLAVAVFLGVKLAGPWIRPLMPGPPVPRGLLDRDHDPPDPPPAGAVEPTAGKSTVVAAPTLREVDAFRRKVVFYAKDVDLPCLRVPGPQGDSRSFLSQVGPCLGEGTPMSFATVMTKSGELLFCDEKTVYRATKDGAEKVLAISDLTMTCPKPLPPGLHFGAILTASTTKDLVYVQLETYPGADVDPGPYTAAEYPEFVGKLDLESRRLLLVEAMPFVVAIDPDAEVLYRTRAGSIERVDFEGKIARQWPVGAFADICRLAPDGKSLLSEDLLSRRFVLLDLTTGRETPLPIRGRASAYGPDSTIYFVREAQREDGILETSLNRFQIGETKPTRLFFVSCKRVNQLDSLLGTPPRLSADGTWLAWRLPVESPEDGTLLVDLTNQEYRILGGYWMGVDWSGGPSPSKSGYSWQVPAGDTSGIGSDFPDPCVPPEPPPPGAAPPVAGRSTLVAAPFLKKVPELHRKVVFFAKDVDLPCLRVPEPGEVGRDPALGVASRVMETEGGLLSSTVMTKDGDLLLSDWKSILRATKEGQAERLCSLADLTITGSDLKPEDLRILQLLAASTSKDLVYLEVCKGDWGGKAPAPGVSHTFVPMVGRLELATRCLRLTEIPLPTAIDPEAEVLYRTFGNRVEEQDFDGQVKRKWSVRGIPAYCQLAADRKSLLLMHPGQSVRQFTVLDLATGQQTPPVPARVAVAGKKGDMYFLREQRRDDNVLETSLYRLHWGEEAPTRLFFVSSRFVDSPTYLERWPVTLSWDGSWLAWCLPVEHPESGTLLLDLDSQEYRILAGEWAGIQWRWGSGERIPGRTD